MSPKSILPNSTTNKLQGSQPDFGPNVVIFSPETQDFTAIKERSISLLTLDLGQFSKDRLAFLFYPGEYSVDIPVGFYTSVLGLGQSPEEVQIRGEVSSSGVLKGGNSTCNFWRSLENLRVEPRDKTYMKWAVSQAAPLRRIHVKGDLRLVDFGATPWASGGYISNSKIDGRVLALNQQQWLSKNSEFGSWKGAQWNMAFMGVSGSPEEGYWSKESPHSVMDNVPISVEKPLLNVDDQGWNIYIPPVERETSSYKWELDHPQGRRIPLDDFYIAHGQDTSDTLNEALQSGKNLLLTPAVYNLDKPLHVTRAGTILYGLGFATLAVHSGNSALRVDNVPGVRIAGLMVDAGEDISPCLVEIGKSPCQEDFSSDPVVLHDLVIRVGNGSMAKAETALLIHANDVIGDHLWLWAADHDGGNFPISWDTNPCKNGVIVNGDRVSLYGLFCEHFQEFQTLWKGEQGRVYMYQSELPYRADREEWNSSKETRGYASYKVAPEVKDHYAWALGIYMVFGDLCTRAIEAPQSPKVEIHHAMTISIKSGTIGHVVNQAGDSTQVKRTAYLEHYPQRR
jgi:hypothetical protein